MNSKGTAIVLSIFLIPIFSFAQFRKYSNEFLNIGAGARGLAMGSAQVASVKDGTAGYWNPAGLVGVKDHPEVNLQHAEYFAGIGKYDYGSIAIPLQDSSRVIGLSILRFAVDDIPNTLFLVQPDGSIDYGSITSFSSADYAALFSYAQTVVKTYDKLVSFGINAKVIHRQVGHFASAWGFGVDAGIQIHGPRWHLALVARDLTTTFNAWTFKFTEKEKQVLYLTQNDIPVRSTELTSPRLVFGGGYNFKISKTLSLLAEANLDFTFDGKRNTVISSNPISVDPHMGLEASIKDIFFIRAGVTNFQKALSDGDTLNQKKVWIYQPSLGAGVKIKNVVIDYAYANLANQSNPLYTHVFSLKFILVKKEKTTSK